MHTGILESDNVYEVLQSASVALEYQCKFNSLIDGVVPTTCPVSIEDLLHPEGANDCIEEVQDDNLVAQVLEEVNHQEQNVCASEEAYDIVPPPSYKLQLSILALWERMCDANIAHGTMIQQLSSMLRTVRSELQSVAMPPTRRRLKVISNKRLTIRTVLWASW